MPKTSVWMNSPGASIDRSTWVSAAKLTIAPTPSRQRLTASASVMSAVDQLDPGLIEALEVLHPARVGELVEHPNREVGMGLEAVADEGGADEAGAAGHEDVHRTTLASRAARYSLSP